MKSKQRIHLQWPGVPLESLTPSDQKNVEKVLHDPALEDDLAKETVATATERTSSALMSKKLPFGQEI
ncbi:MAG: hypothetical protein M1816_004284 [Peltula sp. TS41687]|nr:MAG: hypothetical protein M1816_004284 [Peltula sp. TS41687]